ncbi:MAG: NYN domain-containing protein [Candidatus Diapherotrites archaeon]|nr:NYN domain-containing protein [Candidatus Diapherotrites archaeon]
MQNRTMIFIDGSNFYHSLKKSFGVTNIDLEKFCAKISQGYSLERIFYYTAPVNQHTHPEQYKNQQKFFSKIKTIQNLQLFLGRLEKRQNNKLIEKAVDVKLIVDLLMNAVNNAYDTAFLVSNDSDFVPAIQEIQKLGKAIIHVSFQKMQSYYLDKICDQTITITDITDVILTANDESEKKI